MPDSTDVFPGSVAGMQQGTVAEEPSEKTPIERCQDMLTALKEMRHYAKLNIEKLTAFWMELDDELKQKTIAGQVNDLLPHQSSFHEGIDKLIEEFEAAIRKQAEAE